MKNINPNNLNIQMDGNKNMKNVSSIQDMDNIMFENMPSPNDIHNIAPLTKVLKNNILNSRQALKNILDRKDPRFIVIVGPCSIHDPIAGFDYAQRLKKLANELSDTLYIIMRVYFEKPRTNIGWKGFINDPYLDGSSQIHTGMRKARQLLLTINELELPIATELLDINSFLYLKDHLSWVAIGARTVESQPHRELASALDVPVGFKNSITGSVDAAINGILSSANPHTFIGLNNYGDSSIIHTSGNRYGHLVLRGGQSPNYDKFNVRLAETKLEQCEMQKNIIIDCSHGNSSKNYKLQETVLENVIEQVCNENNSIVGAMLESNIEEGNQNISSNTSKLLYGCSVTDACINWNTTEKMLYRMYKTLKQAKVMCI